MVNEGVGGTVSLPAPFSYPLNITMNSECTSHLSITEVIFQRLL